MWFFDIRGDGGKKLRICIPDGQASNVTEGPLVPGELQSLTLTLEAFKDAAGKKVYRYYDDGSTPAAPVVTGDAPASVAAAGGDLVTLTGSGFTGTGGPVILIPLLILARQPLATTVAAAQIIQLPIALCASAAHAAAGSLDLPLACLIGAVLLGGSLAGQWLGRRLNTRRLQTAVSLMLLGTGLWFAWRAAA